MTRTLAAFVAGCFVGAACLTGVAQERRLPGVVGINHISIVTDKYDEVMRFYTGTMGFPEAFTVRNAAGQPTLTYLQASRDTFVEIFPASANRQPGFAHYGLAVSDVRALAERLRERGMTVDNPGRSGSGATVVNITDPAGTRIEISELGPESLARQASERWK